MPLFFFGTQINFLRSNPILQNAISTPQEAPRYIHEDIGPLNDSGYFDLASTTDEDIRTSFKTMKNLDKKMILQPWFEGTFPDLDRPISTVAKYEMVYFLLNNLLQPNWETEKWIAEVDFSKPDMSLKSLTIERYNQQPEIPERPFAPDCYCHTISVAKNERIPCICYEPPTAQGEL